MQGFLVEGKREGSHGALRVDVNPAAVSRLSPPFLPSSDLHGSISSCLLTSPSPSLSPFLPSPPSSYSPFAGGALSVNQSRHSARPAAVGKAGNWRAPAAIMISDNIKRKQSFVSISLRGP